MGYLVRAIRTDGVSGSFRAEKDTRSEALWLAKTLRGEGFFVIVTGPDGETIEETEDEPKPGWPTLLAGYWVTDNTPPRQPLVLAPNFRDVRAERIGVITGIVGAPKPPKAKPK
jgi:hypothetical protein